MMIVGATLGSEQSEDYHPILITGGGSGKEVSVPQLMAEMDDYDWYMSEDVDVSEDQRRVRSKHLWR
jgi:hypothetical protein